MFEVRDNKFGKGVYATEDILQGSIIAPWCNYVNEDELLSIPEQERNIEHVTKVGEFRYTLKSDKVDDYFNHSCEPNSGLNFEGADVFLVAIRYIPQGEEIVWDYSTTMDRRAVEMFPEWKMSCSCATRHCRGTVDSFETLPRETRLYYADLGIIPEFLIKFI